jgi:hypothetical protein
MEDIFLVIYTSVDHGSRILDSLFYESSQEKFQSGHEIISDLNTIRPVQICLISFQVLNGGCFYSRAWMLNKC